MSSTMSDRWSWSGETLTLSMRCSGAPAARRATTVRQASARTQRPRARIVPFSSARAMNSSGRVRPRIGWRQRTSASTPTVSPLSSATIGW